MNKISKAEVRIMKKSIRIGTYNIWHGERVKDDVGAIGRALADMEIDIAGIQEVDVGTARMNGMDTLAMIAEAGGYPYYAFAKAFDLGGGGYGTAIVSKYPILSAESEALPSGEYEPRAYGHAVIDINGKRIDFFNTHASVEDDATRREQMTYLAARVKMHKCYIVTGDFNTEELSAFAVFEPCRMINPKRFASFYSTEIAIDHIILEENITPIEAAMPTLELSDNYPVWADVVLP